MTTDAVSPLADPLDSAPPGDAGPEIVTREGDDDLPAVRALILAAYPDVVPDLVAGTTVADLLASVEGARAAYAAVVARIGPTGEGPAGPPVAIPGGGGAPLPVDPDRLPASEKIRRGLRAMPAAPGAPGGPR